MSNVRTNMCFTPGNTLILDVVEQLGNFDSAQSVILISDKKDKAESLIRTLEEHTTKKNVAMTVFDAESTPGESLTQSGELCHHLILLFGKVKNAVEFLNTQNNNLRFSNQIIINFKRPSKSKLFLSFGRKGNAKYFFLIEQTLDALGAQEFFR